MIYPQNFEQKIGFDSIRHLLKEKCLSTLGQERVDEMNWEPECYSLTPEDIDRRDGMFREAFKFRPEGTYVHKQDRCV